MILVAGDRGGSHMEVASAASDFVEITTLDEPDEFVPLGAREPNRVLVLADPDALIRDLDLRAFSAVRAKCELNRFHLDLLLDGSLLAPYSL
jgi:hypothetical protein